MARSKIKRKDYLTPLEWEVMNIIWKLGGKPTVRQVLNEGYPNREKAYTTIQTVMNNIVIKRFLKRKKTGLVNFYSPAVKREDMIVGETNTLVNKAFGGSFLALANYLIDSDTLSQEEIADLKRLIKQKEKDRK